MKVSKKTAIKFACYEYEQRNGDWDTDFKNDDGRFYGAKV